MKELFYLVLTLLVTGGNVFGYFQVELAWYVIAIILVAETSIMYYIKKRLAVDVIEATEYISTILTMGIWCQLVDTTSTKLWIFAALAVLFYIMIQSSVIKDRNFELLTHRYGNLKLLITSFAVLGFSIYMAWTTPWFISKCVAIFIAFCIVFIFVDMGSSETCEETKRRQSEDDKKAREDEEKAKEDYKFHLNRYNQSHFAKIHKVPYETVLNDKGLYAEYVVSTYMECDSSYHHILYNVYIPTKSKVGFTETDVVFISQRKILCMEIKNRSVRYTIPGMEESCKITFSNGKSELDKNPFVQNKYHIDMLNKYLGSNGTNAYVNGFVIFGPDVLDYEIIGKDDITQGFCSYEQIEKFLSSGTIKYDKEEVDKIYTLLSKLEGNDSSKAKHLHNIWKRYGV